MVVFPRFGLRRAVSLALVLAVVVLALGLPKGIASATDNGATSIEPYGSTSETPRSNFTYKLAPGATVQDYIVVSNRTDHTLHYYVYAANAFNTAEGGLAVNAREQPTSGATTWVSVPASAQDGRLEIPSGAQAQIPISVTVPPGTSGGDYATGVAAVPVEADGSTEGNLQIDVAKAVAVAMFIRVDGPLTPSLRVENIRVEASTPKVPFLTDGQTNIVFDIVNDGTARLSPTVDVSVEGLVGQEIHKFDSATYPNLLPGGRFTLTREWNGAPLLGKGSVKVAVTAEGVSTERSASFWATPWWLLALVLIAALAVVGRRVWKRRQLRRSSDGSGQDAAPDLVPSP